MVASDCHELGQRYECDYWLWIRLEPGRCQGQVHIEWPRSQSFHLRLHQWSLEKMVPFSNIWLKCQDSRGLDESENGAHRLDLDRRIAKHVGWRSLSQFQPDRLVQPGHIIYCWRFKDQFPSSHSHKWKLYQNYWLIQELSRRNDGNCSSK